MTAIPKDNLSSFTISCTTFTFDHKKHSDVMREACALKSRITIAFRLDLHNVINTVLIVLRRQ